MRKYLFSMLAMATMLFAASCTQEDDFRGNDGNEVEALFTVELPAGVATRAAGDGTTVNKVKCVVYEFFGNDQKEVLGELTKVVDITGKAATYNTRLIKGRAYRVVFFAYNEAANAYNLDDMENITFNSPINSNKENRDAFTAYVDVTATESLNVIKKPVTLKRPFAQLNVGSTAADTEAARKAAGVAAGEDVMSKSYIKVTGVYNTFDAFASVAKGTPATMEYAMSDVLTESLSVDGVDYTYAAMNYILAGEKTTTNVTFNWEDAEGNQNAENVVWANVPLQRNYRTNIIGSVLTNPAEFNITIDAEFKGEHLITAKVSTVLDLQNAINNAKPGLNVISFNKDIVDVTRADAAGPVEIIIPQVEGVDYIIDGCGFKFSGRFSIHGNSRHTGAETLTFKNINFVATTAGDFISCDWTDNARRYAHNVTVEDCTFTGVDGADVVGMRFRQCYNITVKNVKAENLFLLLWSTGGNNVTVDGAKANVKYGISFGDTNNVVVRNSEITATGAYSYAVRVDAKSAYNAAISTSTLKAVCPVIVRYATAAYTMALDGNTIEKTGNYDVVVTNGNYGEAAHALALPTGAYTLTGAEGYVVYPSIVCVSTAAELQHALDNAFVGNNVINFVADIAGDVTITEKKGNRKNFIIDGCNYKYDGTINVYGESEKGEETLLIRNVNFETSTANRDFISSADPENGSNTWRYANNVTIENCTFTAVEGSPAEHTSVGVRMNKAYNVALNGCTGTNLHSLLQAESCDTEITVDGATVVNGKNGLSFNNTRVASISNSEIESVVEGGYGIRHKGEVDGYALNINGCSIEAFVPVLVRNMTAKGYALTFTGENTLTETNNDYDYQIVISKTDYDGTQELVMPTGTFTLTGADGFNIYPDYIKEGVKYTVYTAKGLKEVNAMFVNKTAGRDAILNLAADIDFTGYTWTPVDSHADSAFEIAEINGNGHTISNLAISGQAMFTRFAGAGNVVVKDITFDNATVNTTGINASIITVQSYQNVLLDNVDVKNSSITGAYKVAPLIGTVYNESPSSVITATLKNCDIDNVTVKATTHDFCTTGMVAFVNAGDNDKIEFENCTIKNLKLSAPNSYRAHAWIYTEGSEDLFDEAEGVTVDEPTCSFKNI